MLLYFIRTGLGLIKLYNNINLITYLNNKIFLPLPYVIIRKTQNSDFLACMNISESSK